MKNALFEFFSKMSLAIVHSSFLHWWGGGEEERIWGFKLMWIWILMLWFFCWLSLAALHSKHTNLVWRSSASASWSTSLVKWMFSTTLIILWWRSQKCASKLFLEIRIELNFFKNMICERRRHEWNLQCTKFSNQINPMDLI